MAGGSAGAEKAVSGGGARGDTRLRLDWLDALKGLGILAVVAGHVWTQGRLRDAIYSFHMPLFFLASGYAAHAHPMRLLAPRLLRALGLPFLVFSVLLLGADVLIEGLRDMRPIFATPWAGMMTILFASEKLRGPFAILWFVPCLLVARLLWNALLRAGGEPQRGWLPWTMALVASLALALDRWVTHSPFGLIAVPAALLFLWLGALGRDWRPRGWLAVLLALAALVALIVLPPLNLHVGDVGPPLLGLAGAAVIVERLAALVRALPDAALRPLIRLGRASLVIMYAHLAFIHYLAPYAPRYVLFVMAVAGALLIDALARSSRAGRLLLLGER
jgi:fucose 4-O-acetylase-like acetyltransferase